MGQPLKRFAQEVIDRRLNFLNAGNVIRANDQREIRQATSQDFAAIIAEQCNREQSALSRFFERKKAVA